MKTILNGEKMEIVIDFMLVFSQSNTETVSLGALLSKLISSINKQDVCDNLMFEVPIGESTVIQDDQLGIEYSVKMGINTITVIKLKSTFNQPALALFKSCKESVPLSSAIALQVA